MIIIIIISLFRDTEKNIGEKNQIFIIFRKRFFVIDIIIIKFKCLKRGVITVNNDLIYVIECNVIFQISKIITKMKK